MLRIAGGILLAVFVLWVISLIIGELRLNGVIK